VAGGHRGRFGQSFADILNSQMTATGSETAESTAPAARQSFGDFLNHRRTQMGLDEEREQKSGESAMAYLNRHMKVKTKAEVEADAAKAKKMAEAAGTMKKRAARPGETAIDEVNHEQTVDEAAKRHAKAEKAAEGLVSNALILPILKQVRRSAFAQNDVFSGGNGEKAFGPEFDMQLSDRIAKSPRLGVKNALVARLEKHQGVTPKTKPVTTTVKTNGKLDVNG
jgi:hypothetical protein